MEIRAVSTYDNDDLNLKLRLGLPGTTDQESETVETSSANSRNSRKRYSDELGCSSSDDSQDFAPPPPKAQVVGWPPVRSYRKNILQACKPAPETSSEQAGIYVKVSMDGAPYLRKMDLNLYKSYPDLVKGLEKMFKCNIGVYSERENHTKNGSSEYAPTYEDKDGDWMLAGDVPWEMFINNCTRLRVVKLKDLKLN